MVGSLLVDGLSKHDDCNEDTVTAMRSKEDLAVVSPEKKRSRDEVLAIVPTEKKQRSRDVDLETKEDDSFNKALAAHPDVRSTIPERKKTNDDDLEPTVLERNKKDDDGIESFLVASFKNDDVQAMRDDRVECIYESLQGRLGFFRFRKRGLIDNEDGFSAQISYAIGNSFPPFDRFSSMVPVTACKYKNMNIAVKNLADGFPQMRYVMVEDSETTTNKCAAQMVKETVNRTRYIVGGSDTTHQPKRKLGDVVILVDALKILTLLYGREKINSNFYSSSPKTAEAFFSSPYGFELQSSLGFPGFNP